MKRLMHIAALAALATLILATPLVANAGGMPGTITVTGQASLLAPPDQVELTVGVKTLRPTAKEAAQANAATMGQVIKGLKGVMGKADRLQTISYRVYPRHKWDPKKKENLLVGYEAINQVRVVSTDTAKASKLLDVASAAGANQISGPAWTLSNPNLMLSRAQVAALQDAKAKALALTKAAGVILGGIKSISAQTNGIRPTPYPEAKMAMVARAPATPVESGVKSISAQVRCVFYLKTR